MNPTFPFLGTLLQKSLVYFLLFALAICVIIYVIRLYRLKVCLMYSSNNDIHSFSLFWNYAYVTNFGLQTRREEIGTLEPKTEMGGYSWITKQGLS